MQVFGEGTQPPSLLPIPPHLRHSWASEPSHLLFPLSRWFFPHLVHDPLSHSLPSGLYPLVAFSGSPSLTSLIKIPSFLPMTLLIACPRFILPFGSCKYQLYFYRFLSLVPIRAGIYCGLQAFDCGL